jgi:hypothetical protein
MQCATAVTCWWNLNFVTQPRKQNTGKLAAAPSTTLPYDAHLRQRPRATVTGVRLERVVHDRKAANSTPFLFHARQNLPVCLLLANSMKYCFYSESKIISAGQEFPILRAT